MIGKKVKSHPGERVLFETRPRFMVSLKSTFLKFIILLIIFRFFSSIVEATANLQNYIITMVQIPLVASVTIILMLLALFLFFWIIWDVVSWKSISYLVTDRRVIVRRGLLRKKRVFMHYNKIQDVSVSQSITERIFNSGDIEIFGGHERTTLLLEDIPDPGEVEDMINRLIEGDSDLEADYESYDSEVYNKVYKKPPKQRQKQRFEGDIISDYDKKFKK
ncbi:PH domain-containing protein [Methanobacterium aggregans]|uniref:PH domain-containing protein n=1 Tax=Methanobacterium aggregans TaxID=1615586 RepID=UPI001AE7AE28|nr:PH domain-containing protein [Methanobacterium aggregans]MBP2045691.1 membrane protein YdbS with pleckstrin-like domain [Methanobacterium aggregans]